MDSYITSLYNLVSFLLVLSLLCRVIPSHPLRYVTESYSTMNAHRLHNEIRNLHEMKLITMLLLILHYGYNSLWSIHYDLFIMIYSLWSIHYDLFITIYHYSYKLQTLYFWSDSSSVLVFDNRNCFSLKFSCNSIW